MNTLKLPSFCLYALVFYFSLYPFKSLALAADATQIAYFKADHVSFNQDTGTTLYIGHVDMKQGTTQVTADKVVVYKDQAGNIKQVIATGKPARYITLPDNQKKPVDASGETILYEPQKQLATLLVNGTIIQGMNSLKGEHIIYDIARRTITSIPGSGKNDPKSLLILQPQNTPGTSSEKGY